MCPTRTTLDIGPTGIIPGRYSHTWLSSTDCMQAREVDQPLVVEVRVTHHFLAQNMSSLC